jgi:hypothetical protein
MFGLAVVTGGVRGSPQRGSRSGQKGSSRRRIRRSDCRRFQGWEAASDRARDNLNVRAAEKTAEEEAAGAGLTRFASVVTVTLPPARSGRAAGEDGRLREIEAIVSSLGQGARIRLRKPEGGQAATFLAGLPLGLVLPAHSNVPQYLRDMQ